MLLYQASFSVINMSGLHSCSHLEPSQLAAWQHWIVKNITVSAWHQGKIW